MNTTRKIAAAKAGTQLLQLPEKMYKRSCVPLYGGGRWLPAFAGMTMENQE